jgi:uncharacterized protein with HEPN domain
MRREVLLLEEMIDAAEQAHGLVAGIDVAHLAADRQRRDALLWNFTVLGEASGQLRAGFKERFRDVPGQLPIRMRNRIVHGYWSIDLEVLHTTAETQLLQFADQLRAVHAAIALDERHGDGMCRLSRSSPSAVEPPAA